MRRVGEALAARYIEIGQTVAARIVDEIPDYRDLAPDVIADLRAGATATVELLARTFAAGSTVRREHLGFLRELAARRVHQGVGLDVFTHAYRVALLAYWDACAEEASRLRLSREAGFALAGSAIEAIDIITTQAAEAYLREESRLRTQTGRAARDLLERLINGQPIEPRDDATPPPPVWTRPESSSRLSDGSSGPRSRPATHSKSPGRHSRRACCSEPPGPSWRFATESSS